ncbi:unnamed protein product [Ostreobium quekettii]|uniref:Ferric reductase n=1 Tax=Ostreobium quekettii TaxID=121088 RepID=A0A8S1IS48_9CHLO|nr:unnamed protein product [Ostreobium quekettii]
MTGIPVERPDWYYKLDGVALSLGVTSFQNLMWLFFPIVRVSPLFDALGLPFEKRIRYHRWLGHMTMVILATHGFLYWIVRVSVDQWVEEALQWTDHRNVNNFAGGISLWFGIALWVTALEWTRRRYFEVFYRTHIVSFVGFLIFGILHAPGMHVYLGAGLLIYCLDLVLRLTQLSTPVKVKWSGSTSDGSIAVIGFDTVKPLCPFSTFFVNIGSISKVQWHPVTPVMMGGGTGMKVCFKKFGNWTSRLVEEAAAGRLTTARLEGPFSTTADSCHFHEHEYLVMVAGGIAITPLLTILKKLVIANAWDAGKVGRRRSAKADEPSPRGAPRARKVVVLWTMRNIAEAELMDEELFAYSRAQPDLLDIRIHYTGKVPLDNWTGTMIRVKKEVDHADMISAEFGDTRASKSGKASPAVPHIEPNQVGDLFRRVSPTTLPMYSGPLHLAGLNILVYAAALMGLIMGISYPLEAIRSGEETSRGKVDMVVMFTMCMMAIGAVTLFVFPAHLSLYRRAREKQALQMVAAPKPEPTKLSSTTILWISRTQDISMDGMDLVAGPREISDTPVFSASTIDWIKENRKNGRPDVDKVLDDVNAHLSPGCTAAVITAGARCCEPLATE